jgi:hypothetical protein
MSQDDFSIADQPGAGFLSELNSQLQALATLSSGATAPTTTYAYQLWYDTANSVLKIRDGANTAWVTIGNPASNSSVDMYVANALRARLNATGFGVGVSSPAYALDVLGDVNVTGAFRLAGSDIRQVITGGSKNKIINGDFNIWQRGASIVPALSTIAYTADRFYAFVTGAAPTYARVTLGGSAGVTGCDTALQITGIASNTLNNLGQRIEAANCTDMMVGKVFTLSTWIYCTSGSLSPNFSVNTAGAGDNFTTINALTSGSLGTVPATTWTKVSATFTCTNECLKGIQTELNFGAITGGRTVLVTGFQLEAGSVATPFEKRLFATELLNCQRYYETGNYIWRGYVVSGNGYGGSVTFKVVKRNPPAIANQTNAASFFPATNSTINGSGFTEFDISRVANATGSGTFADNWQANAEL